MKTHYVFTMIVREVLFSNTNFPVYYGQCMYTRIVGEMVVNKF
jgi:hypothetical protein